MICEEYFNKKSKDVEELKQELHEMGEDDLYLTQLLNAYLECYPGDEFIALKEYYSHLVSIKLMKYGSVRE